MYAGEIRHVQLSVRRGPLYGYWKSLVDYLRATNGMLGDEFEGNKGSTFGSVGGASSKARVWRNGCPL